jgi:hypothetical protein
MYIPEGKRDVTLLLKETQFSYSKTNAIRDKNIDILNYPLVDFKYRQYQNCFK